MSSEERQTALILVADDDPDILELVQMVMEDEGYDVVTATDGEQALALAVDRRPDLCLLDVMMPKLDGCEVTAKVRAAGDIRKTPIILLSARTQREAVERGRVAGADEYVTKPFIPEDLQRSVRGLLASSGANEEPVLGLVEGGQEPSPSAERLILVAAADENLVKLVAYRLELGGFEVATAHDSEQALQLATERPPDLCIVDESISPLGEHPVKRLEGQFGVQELYEEIETILSAAGHARTA